MRSVSQRTSHERIDDNEAAALATDLSSRLTLNQKRLKVLPQVVIDKLRITEDSTESIHLLNQALKPGGGMRVIMKKPVPSNRTIDIDQILEAKRNEKQSSSLAMSSMPVVVKDESSGRSSSIIVSKSGGSRMSSHNQQQAKPQQHQPKVI